MKYLKRFENIEEDNTIKDIEDILLEISDQGIPVDVNKINKKDVNSPNKEYYIYIGSHRPTIIFKNISETIFRILDYLKIYDMKISEINYQDKTYHYKINQNSFKLMDLIKNILYKNIIF